MKLQLSVNKAPLNGYLNLDPSPVDPDVQPAYTGNFGDLSVIVEISECTEILADEVLDFVSAEDTYPSLEYWSKLLRHGGSLIVGGTDLYEVSKAVVNQTLNIREANEVLHGVGVARINQMSIVDLCEILKSLGLIIISKRINGFKMVVTAERK